MIRIKRCEECGKTYNANYHQRQRFCRMSCADAWKRRTYPKMFSMKTHTCWKGGKYTSAAGYVLIRQQNHRYAYEHRVVMERCLGRTLLRNEDVHHLNGIKHDNRIENLVVLTKTEHTKTHHPHPERQCLVCRKSIYHRRKFCSRRCSGLATRWPKKLRQHPQ